MRYEIPANAYPASITALAGGCLYLADLGQEDGLFYAGKTCPLPAEPAGEELFRIPMTYDTARALWKLLPWSGPQRVLTQPRTFGTGDRLGLATVGQIRAVEGFDVYPVLAQQSMRELSLTGRTYRDVLADVTFQVLKAGYRRGYGADGDHLKNAEDILAAIADGVTMITLDCSEHIHCERTAALVSDERRARYLSGEIAVGAHRLRFTPETLALAEAIFGEAIAFAIDIYHRCIEGSAVDFEISMDETDLSTTPEQHYFVANELRLAGIPFATLAPRFCGEFQKGVDYIGDLAQFDREIVIHAAIADALGYKLSIHSGSDKFSVFAAIGRATGERFHAKTSGTSWLEAMRLVAQKEPALFRACYAYAQEVFTECRAYYHVSTELSMVPAIETMPDDVLPTLLDRVPSRQLLHITYGKILNHPALRAPLFRLWRDCRDAYETLEKNHLARHLALLCPEHAIAPQ